MYDPCMIHIIYDSHMIQIWFIYDPGVDGRIVAGTPMIPFQQSWTVLSE